MSFTPDQLQQLGFVLQPDGSFSKQSHATKRNPANLAKKKKARPHGLSNSLPQPIAEQTLDGGPPRQESRQGSPSVCSPRFRLTITRYSTRSLDADNLAGGCKPLIDAVRRAGLIPDDDPKSVELLFAQQSCSKGEERTELEIYERNFVA